MTRIEDGRPAARTATGRVTQVVLWLITMGALVLVGYALRDRWADVTAAGGLPGIAPLTLAVAFGIAANLLLARTWASLVAVAAPRPSWRVASWVWASSQLSRYALSGAQIGGRAVAARRYGMTATAGGVTALIEVAWQVALNAAVVLATLPWWLGDADGVRWVAVAGVVPVGVLVVGSLAPRWLLGRLAALVRVGWVDRLTRGRLRGSLAAVALDRRTAAGLTAAYALNTVLRFAAFLILLVAVGGDSGSVALRAAGAYALGQFVGRLAIFAPGGIGPREGVTALVLAPAIGGPAALLLVAVVRLTEIVAELLTVALARTWRPEPVASLTGGRGRSS